MFPHLYRDICIETCAYSSGEPFLRKGFPPTPFPKTFIWFFSDRAHLLYKKFYIFVSALSEKTKMKVFGREFERSPFFKRGSLNNKRKFHAYTTI
jgi:hypothetical protein